MPSVRLLQAVDRAYVALGWQFIIDKKSTLASWWNPNERCSRNTKGSKTLIPIDSLLVNHITGEWYIEGYRACLSSKQRCVLRGKRPKPPSCTDSLWDLARAAEF
ncbi:hypothetical protein IAU59_007642 [Kwoniella sp. CBS 9459]